jgi:DNA-binding response OmpR family regulator
MNSTNHTAGSMRIALLNDVPVESDLACQVLKAAGYSIDVFRNGEALLNRMSADTCDMLVLDLQASDGSAARVLQWARENCSPALPVLVLAGRACEDLVAGALNAGANDYIIKPVRQHDLLTRVHIQLHQAYPERTMPEEIRFGEYVFEARTSGLRLAGRDINVTQKEFDLALLFFRNLGRPLSRAYILEAIWSHDGDVPSRTVDTHVSRVRSKLQLRPEHGFRLTPVYSFGYRLEQL